MIKIPKDFEDCIKAGGKVRTKELKKDRYINICYDKDGNSHSGEVKVRKKSSAASKDVKQTIEDSKKLLKSLAELQSYFNSNYRT